MASELNPVNETVVILLALNVWSRYHIWIRVTEVWKAGHSDEIVLLLLEPVNYYTVCVVLL